LTSLKPKIFYGWYVLAGAAAVLFFVQGARAIIGVMFKPILHDLMISRSLLSSAVSLNMVIFALSLTIVGRLYDRYGAKWVIIVSTLCLSAGFVGIAFIHEPWQLLLLYGLPVAIGFGGTSIPLFAALSSKWFHHRQGLAIGLALGGSCLGQYVLVPVSTRMMLGLGWRTAFIVIGLTIAVVNLLLALTVIKDDPEKLGLTPYGRGTQNHPHTDAQPGAPAGGIVDFNLRQAIGTRSFWMFLIVMVICGGGDNFILTHLIPMATDYGISPIRAGNMLAWSGLLSLAGVLATGPAVDRFGNKAPIVATFLIRAAVFALVLKYQTAVSFYILATVFGFTMLVTAPIAVTLLGKLYGFKHVGLLSGFITTLHHLGGGLWAYLGGFIFDHTGSYQTAFALSAASALVAVVCALTIKEKRHGLG
jgi:MFS family permease